MRYRLDKRELLNILGQWNGFMRRRIHLIACGGTALTLMGIKPSTKDVDFEDCLMLVKAQRDEIDIERVQGHYMEMASYDISQDRLAGNIEAFIELLKEEKLYG